MCGAVALYFGCCRRRFWCAFSQSLWHWANARNACSRCSIPSCNWQLARCSSSTASVVLRSQVRPIKPGKSAYFTCQDFRETEKNKCKMCNAPRLTDLWNLQQKQLHQQQPQSQQRHQHQHQRQWKTKANGVERFSYFWWEEVKGIYPKIPFGTDEISRWSCNFRAIKNNRRLLMDWTRSRTRVTVIRGMP